MSAASRAQHGTTPVVKISGCYGPTPNSVALRRDVYSLVFLFVGVQVHAFVALSNVC